jgi:pimeloyl-ACP methyl ester carboxylesterase
VRLAIDQAGGGEPLVLIHGLATSRQIWNAVVPALSQKRRVVTLDVPGFGESEPVGTGFELEAVAERIAEGLGAAGVEQPFDLVGHSLGAGVAMTLAWTKPDTVGRPVLVAPAGLAAVPRPASVALSGTAEALLATRRRLAPLTDLRWGRRLLLGFSAADAAGISPTQARMLVEASASARRTTSALSTITRSDLRPLLARCPAPLGAIWGASDRTVPLRVADVIRNARPEAEIGTIKDAGHVVMVERPAAFAAALGGLLSTLPKHATTRCRVFFDPDEGHHFFRRRLRTILALLVGREQHAGEGVATTIDGARELARGGSARERRKTSVGSSADVRAG